jgi:catechol 2,3-dioxygenase-like lactoylglutathione lyase family enzyme
LSDAGVRRRICIDHMNLAVADLARSRDFYTRALEPLGMHMVEYSGGEIGFGPPGAEDLGLVEGGPAQPPLHIAFAAATRAEVEAFYAAALEAGGTDNGPPGIRERYSPGYYAAFVLDPDGNNVEAVLHERTS